MTTMTTMTKELTPLQVIGFINDATTVFLTTYVHNGPVQYRVERACYQENIISFITANETYFLVDREIENIYLDEDDGICIHTPDGSYSLRKGFDFDIYAEYGMFKMLEPHEIRACIRRGREIEDFINMKVAFKDKDGNFANVSVHFEIHLETDDYDLEDPDSYLTYSYLFQVFLNNTRYSTLAKDIRMPLEMTNENALDWVLFNLHRDYPTIEVCNKA